MPGLQGPSRRAAGMLTPAPADGCTPMMATMGTNSGVNALMDALNEALPDARVRAALARVGADSAPGADTPAVLRGIGYDEEKIAMMMESGAAFGTAA